MFKVAAVPPRRFAMVTVFRGTTAINDGTSAEPRPVAYPGWFFGCPETPPAMIFFNQGRDTLAGTDLH